MRARESSTPVPDRTPSTHTASADEGGNESRGGTEVNYQIDVQPQSTLCPLLPLTPSWNQPPTLRRNRAGLSPANRQLYTVYATQLYLHDFFPTARLSQKFVP